MPVPFLLSRVLLRFAEESEDLLGELSAVVRTPDGNLWLGSDELNTIERLSPIEPYIFGKHQPFKVGDFVPLLNQEDEIDIEGIDYSDSYLWIAGSHSLKRKKPKGKNSDKDIRRLAEIQRELNRYLIARIPVIEGELYKTCPHPRDPDRELTAAYLQRTEESNQLIDVLKEDEHLGPYLSMPIPGKENGFDIEGLAVYKDRLFLGLRGPVLQSWSVILEIEVKELELGVLTLKTLGKDGKKYIKHFLELNGLGIRELCFCGDDLIILAGPTMQLEGEMRLFRLKKVLERSHDSLIWETSNHLEVLFDLPFTIGSDHAEGLSLFPCLGQQNALMVVYDLPDERRRIAPNAVFADVFLLE
ncbi:DUF3616 domain-containing protein [Leptothermofonsia sp. ETS-13]|uniref:DUF3616 domain-containing protein n=1 Tax=Leptothermofonsia sp. ETS-13 TaxID=3035696 RepID=UPI003B9F0CF2